MKYVRTIWTADSGAFIAQSLRWRADVAFALTSLAIVCRHDDPDMVLTAYRFAATWGRTVACACVVLGSGCSVSRSTSAPPTYDEAVAPIIVERCVACHGPRDPAGGWRAASYLEVIACVADGRTAVLPANEDAPILRVLTNATHASILSQNERDVVAAWVRAGAPKFRGTAHAPSFVDPRSEQSHGRVLRSKNWSPMLDSTSPESCGRCHDGAPSRPESVTSSAPGAPACTTCHQEPGGALGCNTCHGQGSGEATTATTVKSYPPRNPCFFPGDSNVADAHAAHVDGPHTSGLACSSCHPHPGDPIIGGTHGNGSIDVKLDTKAAGDKATFDASTKVCTTACHARAGGARPTPAWTESTPMACGDCHASPPARHFQGACAGCHAGVNPDGTAFVTKANLHANGHVDLGDGSGTCGACHGKGEDPWPSTNAHPSHEKPSSAMAVPCGSCHVVPTTFGPGTPHPRGGPATVTLAGLAVARATPAAYAAGSCREVYCHGAGLGGTVADVPVWTDASGSARGCGKCHGLPPPAPHVASPACDLCHRDGVVGPSGARIAPSWTFLHVNGVVDRGGN